ncbi:hypothetical protein PsAD2_01628 [Pseudovibrio axinellae]|uniref:Uncharacterized protein n=1 Tax=Pseudovibrio axinellae TaxID=989403 RepID=A0A165ZQ50_9HYPH|nr:hypothetical protein [Pseudovibrio axinellae]KZL20141.1 hypothetical protein PsAD2_01628 [Pseudovibrio axinellae]SEQ23569.1 hypothetical protein SAMN05421798_102209 [Pseudovibrio axinellae]
MQYSLFDDHLPGGTSARVSEELGSGSQFKYWSGTSGHRYLFTRISPEETADYAENLVLIKDGKSEAVIWLGYMGMPNEKNPMPVIKSSHEAYVHLLAADSVERDHAHNDLRTGIFSYIKPEDE